MLKFKTSCAVLAYLSSNLLNEVGLSLFRYFEVGLRVCEIVVKKFTFAISSPDEFLLRYASGRTDKQTDRHADHNNSHHFRGRSYNQRKLSVQLLCAALRSLRVRRQSAGEARKDFTVIVTRHC